MTAPICQESRVDKYRHLRSLKVLREVFDDALQQLFDAKAALHVDPHDFNSAEWDAALQRWETTVTTIKAKRAFNEATILCLRVELGLPSEPDVKKWD